MRVKSLLRRMDMNTKKVTGQELSDIKIGNLRFSAREEYLRKCRPGLPILNVNFVQHGYSQ